MVSRIYANGTGIRVSNTGAFQASIKKALSQLPRTGGRIVIPPAESGQEYIVDNGDGTGNGILVQGRPGVTIELERGAVLRTGSGITNLFSVTGSAFTLEGEGTLRATTGSKLLNVVATAAGDGDFVNVRDIIFDATDASGSYIACSVQGNGTTATTLLRSPRINGCRFYCPDSSADGANFKAIQVKNTTTGWIQNNHFGARFADNFETYCLYLIDAIDAWFLETSSNAWRYVNATTHLNYRVAVAQEAGHGVIHGNRGENGDCDYNIDIQGVDFMSVTDNNLGRHSDCIARIHLGVKANGSTGGRSCLLAGNSMHVSDGTGLRYGYHIEDFDGVQITDAHYYNMHDSGTFVRVEDTATNVLVDEGSCTVIPAAGATGITVVDWEHQPTSEYVAP